MQRRPSREVPGSIRELAGTGIRERRNIARRRRAGKPTEIEGQKSERAKVHI